MPDFLRPASPPSPAALPFAASPPNTSGRLIPIDKLSPMERRRREIEDEAGLNVLLSGGRQAPPSDVKYDDDDGK